MYSAQQRYEEYKQIKKQMYKIHLPHLESGYLKKVDHETTLNSEGKQDWIFHYTPGPKAEAEFRAFNGKHATIADSLDQDSILPLEASEASAPDSARDLVEYFQNFTHSDTTISSAKDLALAKSWISQYGIEQARFIVDYSVGEADSSKYDVKMLVGIRKYADAAIKQFTAREAQRLEETRKKREDRLKEQFEHYRDQEIARIKSTMSADELADLESTIRVDLQAKGSKPLTLEMEMRHRRDKQLEIRAGVLTFEEWRKQQP